MIHAVEMKKETSFQRMQLLVKTFELRVGTVNDTQASET